MEKDKRFSGNFNGQTGQSLQATAGAAADDTEGQALEVHWDASNEGSVTLAALFGFAGGTLLVGLVALALAHDPNAGPTRLQIQHRAPQAELQLPAAYPDSPSQTVQTFDPWNFESAMPKASRAPGRNRPDLLSGPEGWTYDSSRGAR